MVVHTARLIIEDLDDHVPVTFLEESAPSTRPRRCARGRTPPNRFGGTSFLPRRTKSRRFISKRRSFPPAGTPRPAPTRRETDRTCQGASSC